ncbi:hypothetical protein K502DRAFT_9031 [Neoconidiobolus thromboides FSU 785]|nr:hypothetical protein K502DRAFT_9031 [Neoconidiobolus thromboides FSU 785]
MKIINLILILSLCIALSAVPTKETKTIKGDQNALIPDQILMVNPSFSRSFFNENLNSDFNLNQNKEQNELVRREDKAGKSKTNWPLIGGIIAVVVVVIIAVAICCCNPRLTSSFCVF